VSPFKKATTKARERKTISGQESNDIFHVEERKKPLLNLMK
jgi:hypothetical protein